MDTPGVLQVPITTSPVACHTSMPSLKASTLSRLSSLILASAIAREDEGISFTCKHDDLEEDIKHLYQSLGQDTNAEHGCKPEDTARAEATTGLLDNLKAFAISSYTRDEHTPVEPTSVFSTSKQFYDLLGFTEEEFTHNLPSSLTQDDHDFLEQAKLFNIRKEALCIVARSILLADPRVSLDFNLLSVLV